MVTVSNHDFHADAWLLRGGRGSGERGRSPSRIQKHLRTATAVMETTVAGRKNRGNEFGEARSGFLGHV
jgi:hypothetical protein